MPRRLVSANLENASRIRAFGSVRIFGHGGLTERAWFIEVQIPRSAIVLLYFRRIKISMDDGQKFIARRFFKLQVFENKGAAYQRLFERVMQLSEPRFVPIKPYGNVGDRRNDGYVRSTGTYYQVYAPERPDSKATESAKKAEDDFEGLLKAWPDIREYRFAYNDEYQGSPPPLEATLESIRTKRKIEAGVFLAKDLENVALDLDTEKIYSILGTIIPDGGLMADVEFDVIGDIVRHVLKFQSPAPTTGLLNAPVFDDKIEFNGLSRSIASLLTVGSYQSDVVTDYFSKNSRHTKQDLRNHLAKMYTESRERHSSSVSSELHGDLVFVDLLTKATPDGQSRPNYERKQVQDAVIVVLAYYFEACDIFEDPVATS